MELRGGATITNTAQEKRRQAGLKAAATKGKACEREAAQKAAETKGPEERRRAALMAAWTRKAKQKNDAENPYSKANYKGR